MSLRAERASVDNPPTGFLVVTCPRLAALPAPENPPEKPLSGKACCEGNFHEARDVPSLPIS